VVAIVAEPPFVSISGGEVTDVVAVDDFDALIDVVHP
jgi:hypothetical protein